MSHDAKRTGILLAKLVFVLGIVAIALQQLAFLLWHHPVSITGVVVLLAVLGYLVFQRLIILLRSGSKLEALQRSIDRSWLHQLGGGNAHGVELWILTILPIVVCIHKVTTVRPFDLFALLDTLVVASVVFVVANLLRLVWSYIKKRPLRQTPPLPTLEKQ